MILDSSENLSANLGFVDCFVALIAFVRLAMTKILDSHESSAEVSLGDFAGFRARKHEIELKRSLSA